MSIIEAVRTYLGTCPLLGGKVLNVDFLPADATAYSVDASPTKPVIKQFLDGSSKRQFDFVLATRAFYGTLIRQQMDNLGLFETFEQWLDAQNKAKNFPDLGEDRTVMKLEVSTSGYVFTQDADMARYQIQCKLTYYQKGER